MGCGDGADPTIIETFNRRHNGDRLCVSVCMCEAQVVFAAHHLPPSPAYVTDAPHTGNGKMTRRNYRYNTFLRRGSKK